MNQLTLEWVEADQVRTQTIAEQPVGKHPGTTRIGRDPTRCDLVLQDPTVSGLHVEIFFDSQRRGFYLRNLRDSNPPTVDKQKLTQGEAALQQGMSICLGQVELKVVAIALEGIPETVLVPPQPAATNSAPPAPHPSVEQSQPAYGLKCPKCHHVSPYERLGLGCPWCGTSLAAAASVLIIPEES